MAAAPPPLPAAPIKRALDEDAAGGRLELPPLLPLLAARRCAPAPALGAPPEVGPRLVRTGCRPTGMGVISGVVLLLPASLRAGAPGSGGRRARGDSRLEFLARGGEVAHRTGELPPPPPPPRDPKDGTPMGRIGLEPGPTRAAASPGGSAASMATTPPPRDADDGGPVGRIGLEPGPTRAAASAGGSAASMATPRTPADATVATDAMELGPPMDEAAAVVTEGAAATARAGRANTGGEGSKPFWMTMSGEAEVGPEPGAWLRCRPSRMRARQGRELDCGCGCGGCGGSCAGCGMSWGGSVRVGGAMAWVVGIGGGAGRREEAMEAVAAAAAAAAALPGGGRGSQEKLSSSSSGPAGCASGLVWVLASGLW